LREEEKEKFFYTTLPKVISLVFIELDCKTIHASLRPDPPLLLLL